MSRGCQPRAIALVAALLLALPAGCGEDDDGEPAPAAEETAERPATGGEQPAEPRQDRERGGAVAGPKPEGEGEGGSGLDRVERIGERVYGDYVEAINARDGERLCSLLADGSLAELRPPVERGGCAESLAASIGHRDPRGFPVWESTALSGLEAVQEGEGWIRVTASIVTAFADREQPSLESDVAYLVREAGSWRLARASAALHRAVGKPDVPPSVIAPPR